MSGVTIRWTTGCSYVEEELKNGEVAGKGDKSYAAVPKPSGGLKLDQEDGKRLLRRGF